MQALHCVSSEIGIIKNLYAIPIRHNDPKYDGYAMNTGSMAYLYGKPVDYTLKAGGCGIDKESAALGLIGESLERYASGFINENEKIIASYKNLNQEAIHPNEISLFHPKQFEQKDFYCHPFKEDTETSWFPTIDLCSGKEILYPGQLIYMPYQEDTIPIAHGNSTGMATHTHYYKAILSGLFEVLERDAFATMWYQNILPPKIKISTDIQKYIDAYFPCRYEIHLFDITFDWVVPVVCGLCYGKNEFGNFVICASASRYTFAETIKKTIQELGQGIPYARSLVKEFEHWHIKDDFSNVDNFNNHAALYIKKPDLAEKVLNKFKQYEATKDIDWNEKSSCTEQEMIQNIVTHCDKNNFQVLVKDLTTVDLEQMGIKAVKVMIPQAVVLGGDFGYYPLGNKRLYEMPKKMGYKVYDFEHLNPYPHLFP